MSIQLSVAVRNARLDAFESTTGTDAILEITGRRNGRPLLMRTPIAHFTVGTPI